MNRPLTTIMIGLVGLVLWSGLARLVGPPLVSAIFEERAPSVFNLLITGRGERPIEYYHEKWENLSQRVQWLLLFSTLVAAGLMTRRVEHLILAKAGDRLSRSPRQDLSRERWILVNGFMGCMVGSFLFAIVADTELWPLSPYAMYPKASSDRIRTLELFGTPVSGGDLRFDRRGYFRQAPGLAVSALSRILDQNGDPAFRLDGALDHLLLDYNRLREEGRHQGPPLIGLRLYRRSWKVDPIAGSSDPPGSPSQELLIREVHLP